MLHYMTESSEPDEEVTFKRVDSDDKIIKIIHNVMGFAKIINDGSIESLGDGLLVKSPNYSVVVLGDIFRVNYYENSGIDIYQYLELNLRDGIGCHNIQKWPIALMILYQDILNITNS